MQKVFNLTRFLRFVVVGSGDGAAPLRGEMEMARQLQKEEEEE
jgi:hypothetical protein